MRIAVRLAKDEEGAALIEYTVILGIILVVALTVIVAVGQWVSGEWVAASTSLTAN